MQNLEENLKFIQNKIDLLTNMANELKKKYPQLTDKQIYINAINLVNKIIDDNESVVNDNERFKILEQLYPDAPLTDI